MIKEYYINKRLLLFSHTEAIHVLAIYIYAIQCYSGVLFLFTGKWMLMSKLSPIYMLIYYNNWKMKKVNLFSVVWHSEAKWYVGASILIHFRSCADPENFSPGMGGSDSYLRFEFARGRARHISGNFINKCNLKKF